MAQRPKAVNPHFIRKCLLVEDSEFDQIRISRMLDCGLDLDLTVASSITEARAALKRDTFDLILLDNALPDGLGVDFAQDIRKDTRSARVPIVMVSDFPSPFMYDKATSANIKFILGKDEFQPKHVHMALRKAA